MKKKFIIITLVLICCLIIFTACSSGNNDDTVEIGGKTITTTHTQHLTSQTDFEKFLLFPNRQRMGLITADMVKNTQVIL